LALVLGRAVDERLVSMIWILYGPETYLKLVHDSGMSPEEYESFLIDASKRLAGLQ
jgi:hypothetical protein